MMQRATDAETRGCVIEVHSFSLEERNAMLPRVYRVLAASGCWTVGYKRRGRRTLEYSFEVELGAVVELYCGLVQAGLEMTEVSHRALTELCVVRTHEQALRSARGLGPHVVSVRLVMSFLDAEEEVELAAVMAASA
jgi:hypothetical protein